MSEVKMKLKEKYRVPKAGSGGKGGVSTGAKKPKVSQGNGIRKKAYGPF